MPRVDAEKMGRVGTYPLQIALYSGLDGKLSTSPIAFCRWAARSLTRATV